ncbi:hypothetical protein DH86_00000785 [Scytalidium sp. 3C]|nr:hypothetical protein DH86_00000785 [Scytalidium sp. 3C]
MEFIVQDVFALTRPQWKLASNLEEATRVFQLAMAQDQKTAGLDKAAEPEEADSDQSSDDGMGDGDGDLEAADHDGDEDDGSATGDESDVDAAGDTERSAHDTDSEEESIVVTREEEQIDPEAEAEFEREYAKMMAESLESRKFERKTTFDVPLPLRRKEGHTTSSNEFGGDESVNDDAAGNGTMAFSLLTKRGNRQQTKTVSLPSDSSFAIAMKTQQAAEREEQQRIKNLVLNYDLTRDGEDQDGLDSAPSPLGYGRADKFNNTRGGQRSRKLQLSDVDWT